MGQPTFSEDIPKTPVVRILTADECAENWISLYGVKNMWAEEYWNGSAWARRFHIFGSGAPSTTYDAFKTIGSTYFNYANGFSYTVLKDDSANLNWVCDMYGGRTTGSDTTAYTSAGQGALILVKDDGTVYIKSEEEGTDETVTLST